ncbi:MAG: mycothiol synthase [Chloroflexi bacterium]|nr:mycothiol synthase [Chloroflexota bacterium]
MRPYHDYTHDQEQKVRLVLVSGLDEETTLPQVQNLLQHTLDHDGHLSIGEHIYLKLKAGQKGNFEENLQAGEESAGAILVYLHQPDHDQEAYPEAEFYGDPQLVGYAQLLAQPHNQPSRLLGELVVHPHLRNRELGRQLLRCMVELGRRGKLERLDVWSYHDNPQASLFARQGGLSPTRVLHHLCLEASHTLPAYELPTDLRLRTFHLGQDDTTWLALNRLVFAEHPENGTWTQADLELRFNQPWFDPHDFLVLEDQTGEILGFNWTKRVPARQSDLHRSPAYPELVQPLPPLLGLPLGPSNGEIYIVGLHPSMRGRGLGRGLTLLGLYHLRLCGATLFSLYVDDTNTAALKLYYSLGFKLDHNDVSYTLDLT